VICEKKDKPNLNDCDKNANKNNNENEINDGSNKNYEKKKTFDMVDKEFLAKKREIFKKRLLKHLITIRAYKIKEYLQKFFLRFYYNSLYLKKLKENDESIKLNISGIYSPNDSFRLDNLENIADEDEKKK
jgi:hypothetical protein